MVVLHGSKEVRNSQFVRELESDDGDGFVHLFSEQVLVAADVNDLRRHGMDLDCNPFIDGLVRIVFSPRRHVTA